MQPGTVIAGRFTLEVRAGAGAMGVVFRARDEHGTPVALKLLPPLSPEAEARFQREVQLHAGLRHEGIVRYVAHGLTEEGLPYLATEWLEGEELRGRLLRGPLSVDEALQLAIRAAEALGALHGAGIVHRDVTPANLVLAGGLPGSVKLIDLGLARRLGGEGLTRIGTILGTPAYMAPEQARSDRAADARSDVFSLGCVLFECLSGAPPFPGADGLAILAKVLLCDAPPLAPVCPAASPALCELVAAMLERDPGRRPAGGAAAATALRALPAPGAPATRRPKLRPGLVQAAAAPTLSAREQRVLSLVLAAPAAPPGSPEEASVAAAAAAAGAELAGLVGGAVLLTVAEAGTDGAIRAARCALRLAALLPGARVAVATGRAVVGSGAAAVEVIDRAAASLRSGKPGQVRVDRASAALLEGRFAVEGDDAIRTLVAERRGAGSLRTVLGRTPPFAGREAELRQLDAALVGVASGSRSRAVLLTAPEGLGKSRLLREFISPTRDRLEATVLRASGDAQGASGPLGPLGEALRRVIGMAGSDPPEQGLRRLRRRLGRLLRGEETGPLVQLLACVAGLAPLPGGTDPIQLADSRRAAIVTWLQAEAEVRPVVLVLDDLHRTDPPTLTLVDAALERLAARPFLVVAAGRPELLSRTPPLWARHQPLLLELRPLSPEAAAEIAAELLGAGVSPAKLAALTERAAGNPFFLEELCRAAASPGAALPDTIVGSVQARLSALPQSTRRVLRAASLFGGVFPVAGVAALVGGGPELEEALAELCASELVEQRGEGAYAFLQELIREAAYASLPEDERVLGHALAGEHLAALGADPLAIARHLTSGGRAAQAIPHHLRAAEQALEASDFDGAVEHAESAVSCGADRELLGAARLVQAEAQRWGGSRVVAAERAREATALLPRGTPAWFRAAGEWLVSGAGEEALALADQVAGEAPPACASAQIVALCRAATTFLQAGHADDAVRFAQAAGAVALVGEVEPLAVGRLHQLSATIGLRNADLGVYLAQNRAALSAFEAAGHSRNASGVRCDLGFALAELGAFEEAEALLREALAGAERLGTSFMIAFAAHNLGWILARLGKLPEARELEMRALRLFEVLQGKGRMVGATRTYLARILALQGELAGAEELLRSALSALAGARPLLAPALAALSGVLRRQGRLEEALSTSAEALGIFEEVGSVDADEGDVWLARAEALLAAGQAAEAGRVIRAGGARLDGRAARIPDPVLRASFLGRIPENARLLALRGQLAREAGEAG